MFYTESFVHQLIQALELLATGDVSGNQAQAFADATLVELGMWDEEQ